MVYLRIMAPKTTTAASTLEALAEHMGGRLALERKARGLTLDDISLRTGVDRTYWSRIERGYLRLSDAKAKALAEIYGVPVATVKSWWKPIADLKPEVA